MKMPVQHQAKVLFSVLAISLITVYQNCNSTRFQTENQVEAASTTPETPDTETEEEPLVANPAPTMPIPGGQTLPPPSGQTGTYSYCEAKQMVLECPDKRPNCTCTDTLPGGRYNSEVLVRATPQGTLNANGRYSMGPNCRIASDSEYLSHSGTVTGLEYGTCQNYCSVLAYCVDGQWQRLSTTW